MVGDITCSVFALLFWAGYIVLIYCQFLTIDMRSLSLAFGQELAKFQELIFEDFDSFILVENTYEDVVLQSVMKDIMMGKRGHLHLWGVNLNEDCITAMLKRAFGPFGMVTHITF